MKRSIRRIAISAAFAAVAVAVPVVPAGAQPPARSCAGDYVYAVSRTSMRFPIRYEEPETVIVDPSAVTDTAGYLVDATTDFLACTLRPW